MASFIDTFTLAGSTPGSKCKHVGSKIVGQVGLYARWLENGRVVAFEIQARIFMISRSKEATRKEEHGFTCGSETTYKPVAGFEKNI